MPANAATDTAIVFTTRMQELADFYRLSLGLGEANGSPGHLGFQAGPVYLGFDQAEEGWASPAAVTLWFRVDDLQAVIAHFLSLGARVNYAPVEVLASIYDLDGNLVSLSQRRGEP